MRIISGEFRGRKLNAPEGLETRPTHERTRQALFNILQTLPRGSRCLDGFAGSGALGLEALSRGAAHCVFVDLSAAASAAISANIESMRLWDRATLHTGDLLAVLAHYDGEPFDLVFLDPPYALGIISDVLGVLLARQLLRPGATIVIEQEKGESPELPQAFAPKTQRNYGKNGIWIYNFVGSDHT